MKISLPSDEWFRRQTNVTNQQTHKHSVIHKYSFFCSNVNLDEGIVLYENQMFLVVNFKYYVEDSNVFLEKWYVIE